MQPDTLPSTLSEALRYQIRTASLPLAMRSIFSHLPEPLVLEVSIGSAVQELPRAAAQLVKMALVSEHLMLGEVTTNVIADGVQMRMRRRNPTPAGRPEWSRELDRPLLQRHLRAVVFDLLWTLLDSEEFGVLLQEFAFRSAVLEALRSITSHMLSIRDVDTSLYVMLSGITSGHALGFNRAALFVPRDHDDGGVGTLVGVKAIGPGDLAEARAIWEHLEYDDKGIDELIEDTANGKFETAFEDHVQTLCLTPTEAPGDELRRALSQDGPCVFDASSLRNPTLAALDPVGPFLLSRVQSHGKTLGLVFADNRYSGEGIHGDQLTYFSFFINQTALIWENLALLELVEWQARVDPLTGALNRRAFETVTRDAVRSSGLLILDIDYFKEVNDSLGHAAGDALLKDLVELLVGSTRALDAVGRLGGDEFVVFVPDCDHEHLRGLARRIGVEALRAGIRLSIGGASGVEGVSDGLLRVADTNLYRAKRAGRGRACIGAEEPFPFVLPIDV